MSTPIDSNNNTSPSSDPSNCEKRYLPRWRVRNPVKFALQEMDEISECETLDLSCAGTCLKLSHSLVPGQKLQMTIFLDAIHSVDISGEVVWNRIAPEGRCAGVEFDPAPLEVHEKILNYAFDVASEDVVKHWFSGWKD